MVALADLWLPILVSAALVFVTSSVFHIVLQLHNKDYGKLPGEDALREAMRQHGVARGHYYFPNAASMKELATPEMQAKLEEGPVGFMTVLPNGMPQMGKSLLLWFVYCAIVSLFAGYIATYACGPGAEYLEVFQIVGATAVLGHAVSYVPDSIWKGLAWSITAKFIFEGVVYGLVTAGSFAWLWPGA